jgi:Transposase DDE domain/Domain of unknown function (DUF4372)
MKFKPAKVIGSVLGQLCKLIPGHLVANLCAQHHQGSQPRTFSSWSHVVSLLYAQLTHSISLNDVCDSLRHHAGALAAIRGATPPARNTLSHANKNRDSDLMETLFWKMLDHLQHQRPGFGLRYEGLPRRFRRAIYAIDSSTIALVANCMSWAKHRQRKAAAKLHLRLNLQTFLPAFAIIEEASHHDDSRARALCAGLQDGEIALFDKAYINFAHLWELTGRGIFWVTRAKDNMSYRVTRKLQAKPQGKVLRDDLIVLKGARSLSQHPGPLRRVEMLVELDGKEVRMAFITNQTEWAASTVGELYQSRWGIEVFFKQIKQTLCICDFLGHSKNAIRWQLWAALLLYVLLRFLAQVSGWPHSFTRLFTMIRGVTWSRVDLLRLLAFYGTAGGPWKMRASPQSVYLPGLEPPVHGTAGVA